jgi:hypothetical protein
VGVYPARVSGSREGGYVEAVPNPCSGIGNGLQGLKGKIRNTRDIQHDVSRVVFKVRRSRSCEGETFASQPASCCI